MYQFINETQHWWEAWVQWRTFTWKQLRPT